MTKTIFITTLMLLAFVLLTVSVFAATSQTSFPVSASVSGKSRTYLWYTGAVTASGNTQLVAAVSGKKIKVVAYELSSNNDVNIKFQSAINDIYGSTLWSATLNWGVSKDLVIINGWPVVRMETNAGEALNLNLSAAAASGVSVSVLYCTEE